MTACGCGAMSRTTRTCCATTPLTPTRRRGSARCARDLVEVLRGRAAWRRLRRPPGDAALAFHCPAPCSTAEDQRQRRRLLRRRASISPRWPTRICAAARPAPIRSCSPSCRRRCATTRWPRWRRAARSHRHRQHRLPDPPAGAGASPVRHWIELIGGEPCPREESETMHSKAGLGRERGQPASLARPARRHSPRKAGR